MSHVDPDATLTPDEIDLDIKRDESDDIYI